jgi:excinuclease UvrABC nuclease subunit
MASGIFSNKQPFNALNISLLPHFPGIYILYLQGRPVYVGRSRVSVKDRLNAHVKCRGSRKVAELVQMQRLLDFECEEMMSPEQAEAQLIEMLGTTEYGNLRGETDPADWD